MNLQKTYLADFVSLLFPELCVACRETLVAGENLLCTDCRFNLPYTNFHMQPDNIVARQFWGKIKVEAAYALFYFTKGGKVQNLMHELKYNGQQRVGNLAGNIAGGQLQQNNVFKTVDYIIPVPLPKNLFEKLSAYQKV